MIRFGKVLTVLTALGLAGCSGAPLGMDVARLSKVDPLTTDPVALRFAIELPANLQTVGGQIQVTGKLDFAPGLAGETYHIAFEQLPNGPAEQRLAQDMKPGHHILAFSHCPFGSGRLSGISRQGAGGGPRRLNLGGRRTLPNWYTRTGQIADGGLPTGRGNYGLRWYVQKP